jgi:MoaA/NifB/PqqE/SkfB family radical SAM enzyme
MAEEYSSDWYLARVRKTSDGVAYPLVIQIELTSYCNAVCFFCAHTWSDRKQQHLKPELFKKIIDEMRRWPFPLSTLYLTGLGEPLMHPNWRELYSYVQYLPAAFTTNCSLLKEEDIDFLLDLRFQEIAFSLDTLNPERHQKIRGFSVDRVAPKIEYALERAKALNVRTRLIVSTTLTHETLDDMKEIYDWLVPKMEGVENATWHIKQIGHFPDIKAPLQIMPSMSFIRKLNSILPTHPKVFPIQDQLLLRPFCTLWFDRLTVLSDGCIVPCCHQAKARQDLGNVETKSLLEIFNSEIWVGTQNKFSLKDGEGGWSQIPYCKDCR